MTQLLPPTTITTALSLAPAGAKLVLNGAPRNLAVEAQFTYGSGGTTVDAYLQTSFDGGASWVDVCNFHFTTSTANALYNLSSATPVTTQRTPTNGTISANTSVDGALGPRFQVQVQSTGTYAGGTSLRLDAASVDLPAFP